MAAEDTIPEAMAEALGQIVAEVRREWQQELEVLRLERRALIAEVRLAALGQPAQHPEPVPAAPRAAKPKGARS